MFGRNGVSLVFAAIAIAALSGYGAHALCVPATTGQFSFDGVSGRMTTSLTASTLLSTGSFTLGFWSRRVSNQTYDVALSMGNTTVPDSILAMGYRDANQTMSVVGRFYFGFYRDDVDAPKAYLDVNVWHHWVATYNGATRVQSLYHNGFLVNQRTSMSSFSPAGNPTLLIGATTVSPNHILPNAGPAYFHGQLDEIAVYTRVLTDDEILLSYSPSYFGAPISTAGQILYLTFAGGSTSDSSPLAQIVVVGGGAVYQSAAVNTRCVCALGLCGNGCINTWVKSNSTTPIGPYNVTNINWRGADANPGTPIPVATQRFSAVIPIPFPFIYYGVERTALILAANGYITFDLGYAGGVDPTLAPIPIVNGLPPNDMLAFWWTNLFGSSDSPVQATRVYYGIDETSPIVPGKRRFFIRLTSIPYDCATLIPVDLQIVLREETHAVEFHYTSVTQGPQVSGDCGGRIFRVVTGIEAPWGTTGVNASMALPTLPNGASAFPPQSLKSVRFQMTRNLPTQTCVNSCATLNLCRNGATCVNSYPAPETTCICAFGWNGDRCQFVDICSSAPCTNGGSCVQTGLTTLTCVCVPGFSGTICQTNINECASNPCQNGGTCADAQNGFTCRCPAGYSGLRCDTEINECASNPCRNGGVCKDLLNGWTCECAPGFSGNACQTNVNECASLPCQNGGTCIDQANSFKCICSGGYGGSVCALIDYCPSQPCQNGATCIPVVNGFTCSCRVGFSGTLCTTDIDECASAPCTNGGSCTDRIGSYGCTCLAGYSGNSCQTEIDECASQPCRFGGTCTDALNGYSCACPGGTTGSRCQTNFDECASNPCANGAQCIDGINSFSCICVAGYSGILCQTQINECASFPCTRGANCTDLINGYSCNCPPGYGGDGCQTEIDECASNPCDNGGTCTDYLLSYSCQCAPGFNGAQCNTDINECVSMPCIYGGTCMDQINGWICQCPPGRMGSVCQYIDACASAPCGPGYCVPDPGNGTYSCVCQSGYSGYQCLTNINECASAPCQNSGTCVDGISTYSCICRPGYSGVNCETDVNECASWPCADGATCIDQVNAYRCHCLAGYVGLRCQTFVDTCASSPCQNGASCITALNGYTCSCVGLFTGPQCQIPTDGCVYGGHYVFSSAKSESLESIAPSGSFDLSNISFSIGAWARRDSTGGFDFILSQGTTPALHQLLYFGFRSTDAFSFGFFDDNLDTDFHYDEIDTWRYWTATYDRDTNVQTLYRDSIVIGTRVAAGPLLPLAGPLRIGASPDFGVETFFDGGLDEIRVFTKKLELSEISYAFDNNGIFSSLPVFYLPFAHGSMIDASYHGGDMMIHSGAPYYQLANSPSECNSRDPCMNATYPFACVYPALCTVSVYNNSNFNCSCADFQFGTYCEFNSTTAAATKGPLISTTTGIIIGASILGFILLVVAGVWFYRRYEPPVPGRHRDTKTDAEAVDITIPGDGRLKTEGDTSSREPSQIGSQIGLNADKPRSSSVSQGNDYGAVTSSGSRRPSDAELAGADAPPPPPVPAIAEEDDNPMMQAARHRGSFVVANAIPEAGVIGTPTGAAPLAVLDATEGADLDPPPPPPAAEPVVTTAPAPVIVGRAVPVPEATGNTTLSGSSPFALPAFPATATAANTGSVGASTVRGPPKPPAVLQAAFNSMNASGSVGRAAGPPKPPQHLASLFAQQQPKPPSS